MKFLPRDHGDRIREGLRKAAEKGRHGGARPKASDAQIEAAIPLGTAEGAKTVNLSRSSFIRRRRIIEERSSKENEAAGLPNRNV